MSEKSLKLLEIVVEKHTFVKYLHGALSAIGSSEWRKGQDLPAWQAP
jgi:hypothetical protein